MCTMQLDAIKSRLDSTTSGLTESMHHVQDLSL